MLDLRAVGIAMMLLAGVATAADPLTETAAAKVAAAKVATDKAAVANTAAREATAARAAAARVVADVSTKLAAAKKTLSARGGAAKAAAEKATKSKSDEDKVAAEKAAADKKVAEEAVAASEAGLATAKKAQAAKDTASREAAEHYTNCRRATYPVIAGKSAAELALTKKIAADRAAAAKTASGNASAAVASVKKAESVAAAAAKNCKECVAAAAAARKAADAEKVAAKSQAEGASAAAEKALAEKEAAVKTATAKAEVAKKARAEKNAAVKTAREMAASAKSAEKKAAAAKKAADKDLSAKKAARKVAVETVNASNLFVALTTVDGAVGARDATMKVMSEKAAVEAKAKSVHAAAKKASDKAAAEKVAAVEALAKVPEENKAAARKTLEAKIAAATTAAEKAGTAKSTADKAAAETRTARIAVDEKSKAIIAARDKEAAARATTLGGLKPMSGGAWDYAKARHLMVRAGFGGTPAEVRKLHEMGLHDAVNHFVEIYDQPVSNLGFDPARLRRPEPWIARLDPVERQAMNVRHRNPERRQQAEMRRWWLRRMAESPRPLQEKLTLFWHDHFATQYMKRYRTYMLFKQNQLFRTYAVDNYAALLRGIVHDPAMISFLDNNANFKGSGNENLGREILELFSMGEGGGYSEEDLREASRSLTGYTYDSWTEQFRFLATRHDGEPKKILGAKGNWAGDDLVDILLRQPATADYVTRKLFKFLVSQEPAEETIGKLAHVMRTCAYDLRPMLKNLLLSEEFYSEAAMGTHIKGPVELAIGTIRDLGIQKSVHYESVDSAVNKMGQQLFEPPNVAGWNENRTWINAERILVRYNEIARLVEQPKVDIVALLEGEDLDTPHKVIEYLAKACLVVPLDAEKTKALAEHLGDLPPAAEWDAKREQINAKLRAVLVLLMSTPESQLG